MDKKNLKKLHKLLSEPGRVISMKESFKDIIPYKVEVISKKKDVKKTA